MRAMLCSICATTQRSASESLASRPRTDANMSRVHWREDFIETLPDARRWKKHTPRLCDTAMTGRSGDAAAGGRFQGRWLFCRLRFFRCGRLLRPARRSEEHTSELQSLMRNSYAVFCLKKKKNQQKK